VVTVVARDRPGLLATLAGALTVGGLDVLEAHLFGTSDGIAIDVFRAVDPFGRVDDDGTELERIISSALDGTLDVAARVEARGRSYARATGARGPVSVEIDAAGSETDTVVEVHADDEIGLLFRIATALAAFELDVRLAKVATLGQRVVDTFYVRDAHGHKIGADAAEELRAALVARLSS
jgi:[protein-PII] uridylyltransferase